MWLAVQRGRPSQGVIVSEGRPARLEVLQTEADEYTRYELLELEGVSFKIGS